MSLVIGGGISAGITLMHVVIVFIGAPAYRYFGAGEQMAGMDAQGSWIPAIITLGIASVFALFALYAFSAVGMIRWLPLLRTMLCVVGMLYVLRGMLVIGDVLKVLEHPTYPSRAIVFSLVSLLTGILHLIGVIRSWNALAPNTHRSR